MSATVAIVLTPTQQVFPLPRDFILQQMSHSILAQALEGDLEAKAIQIDNPLITPNVMAFLVDLSQGVEPEVHLPELKAAGDYLNVPWFDYYSDPAYDYIKDKVNLNAEVNQQGIWQFIKNGNVNAYANLIAKIYDT